LADTRTGYELAPLFQIRMAGVPFDALEGIATPRATALAREIGARAEALDRAARAALDSLRSSPGGLRRRKVERLRRGLGMRLPLGDVPDGAPAAVAAYAAEAAAIDVLRLRHAEVLGEELDLAARALHGAARRWLADYSVFASASVEALAFEDGAGAAPASSPWDRTRDRTLLMYLQRLATKNETFSAYGPSGWGRVDAGARGLRLEPRGELRREVHLERWVADAVVAAMNRDPAVRAEVAPRLHPSARLEDAAAVRLDTGARILLDADPRALLLRCDGTTPAHALGSAERLEALAQAGALLWRVECPAFVQERMGALAGEVARWRDGESRRRWSAVLDALAGLEPAFSRETTPAWRREIVRRARALLAEIGAQGAAPQRTLYRASNPILEECARDCGFVLGGDLAREVTEGAAPWLDLWRDTVAFVAHRTNEKLRALHASLAPKGGAVPLPAFLRAADAAGLPLTLNGLPTVGYLAFLEVKAAFREALAGRADAKAWTLSPGDCGFLRRRFEFPRFEPFTYPSADLQLAAPSAGDVAAGRRQWIIAELHLPPVALQHGIAWACPDPEAFGRGVRAVAGGPFCDWGFIPADMTNHTMLHLESLAEFSTYAGPNALGADRNAVRPADAEVVVDDGDVRIRARGRDRGSFARSWVPALGFHPFLFSLGAHTPRLLVGDVVVQRETWTLARADLPGAPHAPGAPELVLEVDRLRARKGIPRHVYVRPTEGAVRRLGAGGRDKDVKPVFLDLESEPFLEILARWMARHGELEVSEMLPSPADLLWREADGRRTFELRTLVVPRGRG
jgi:hypothetical protein